MNKAMLLCAALLVAAGFFLAVDRSHSVVVAQDDPTPTGVPGAGTAKQKRKILKVDGNGDPIPDTENPGQYETEEIEIPAGATKIGATTSSPHGAHQGGEVVRKVRNDSREDATDVHVHVEPSGLLRVASMSLTGGNTQTEPVGIPGNGPGTGAQVPKGQPGTIVDRNSAGADQPSNGGEVTLNIVLEYWDVDENEWKRWTGQPVTLYVWWTHGDDRDKWIQVGLPEGLGSGDSRSTIASVFPQFDPSPVNAGPIFTATVELNHLGLGEADGHRFQDGTAVIMPNFGTRFKLTEDTKIRAFDEEELELIENPRFSAENLRIDADGNFAFDITRDQEDALHIAIVIEGLELQQLPDYAYPGSSITAGVGGAIFGGRHFDNTWTLIEVPVE
jgi:hypothetical protein